MLRNRVNEDDLWSSVISGVDCLSVCLFRSALMSQHAAEFMNMSTLLIIVRYILCEALNSFNWHHSHMSLYLPCTVHAHSMVSGHSMTL